MLSGVKPLAGPFIFYCATMSVKGCCLRPAVRSEMGKAIDSGLVNSLLCLLRKEGHMQAYCVKCRAKKEVRNPKSIVMKNGRPATQGVCPTCGTKVFRIGK